MSDFDSSFEAYSENAEDMAFVTTSSFEGYSDDDEDMSAFVIMFGSHRSRKHREGFKLEFDEQCDHDFLDLKDYLKKLGCKISAESIYSTSLSREECLDALKKFMEETFKGPRILVYVGQGVDFAARGNSSPNLSFKDVRASWHERQSRSSDDRLLILILSYDSRVFISDGKEDTPDDIWIQSSSGFAKNWISIQEQVNNFQGAETDKELQEKQKNLEDLEKQNLKYYICYAPVGKSHPHVFELQKTDHLTHRKEIKLLGLEKDPASSASWVGSGLPRKISCYSCNSSKRWVTLDAKGACPICLNEKYGIIKLKCGHIACFECLQRREDKINVIVGAEDLINRSLSSDLGVTKATTLSGMSDGDSSFDGYLDDAENMAASAIIFCFHGRQKHKEGVKLEYDEYCDHDRVCLEKCLRKLGCKVSTSISSASLSREQCLVALEKFMHEQFNGPRIAVYIGQGADSEGGWIVKDGSSLSFKDVSGIWHKRQSPSSDDRLLILVFSCFSGVFTKDANNEKPANIWVQSSCGLEHDYYDSSNSFPKNWVAVQSAENDEELQEKQNTLADWAKQSQQSYTCYVPVGASHSHVFELHKTEHRTRKQEIRLLSFEHGPMTPLIDVLPHDGGQSLKIDPPQRSESVTCSSCSGTWS